MFDAKNLLGALMNGGLAGSSTGRVDNALSSQGGGLGQLMQGLGGSGGGAGGLLGGLVQSAGSMLGDTQRAVRDGNPAAVGGLGALAGALLGGGGDSIKGALGGTAMALLGSLAMQALQGSRDSGDAAPPEPPPTDFRPPANPAEEQAQEAQAMLILRAMINAAKADGHVDESELQNIVGRLREAGADPEAEQFVRDAFHQPMETDAIIRDANDPVVAAEVYAASVLAIEVDTFEERNYLSGLARGLNLDEAVTARLHASLGVNV